MLGDTTSNGLPLPGYAIPYRFSPTEVQNFIKTYAGDPVFSQYYYTRQPPYGVIWNNPAGYGQLLLWFDATGQFVIVDVTNMSIATQVQKAPYESPDSSIIDNLIQQVQTFVQQLPTTGDVLKFGELVSLAVIAYFLTQLVSSR